RGRGVRVAGRAGEARRVAGHLGGVLAAARGRDPAQRGAGARGDPGDRGLLTRAGQKRYVAWTIIGVRSSERSAARTSSATSTAIARYGTAPSPSHNPLRNRESPTPARYPQSAGSGASPRV